MSSSKRNSCVATWLTALCLLLAGLCMSAAGAGSAQLTVEVIYADNSGQGVDPRLHRFEQQLNRQFRYSTYRLLGQHQLFQAIGQEGQVLLPGGRQLRMLLQGMSEGTAVLLTSVRQGERVVVPNMVLRLANRGTILVGGPVHEAGVLILAIRAEIQ